MSQILDSMSQSAVVSYPQVLQQLSTESSEKAKDSQVNAILSQGLKQVLNSSLLISFEPFIKAKGCQKKCNMCTTSSFLKLSQIFNKIVQNDNSIKN